MKIPVQIVNRDVSTALHAIRALQNGVAGERPPKLSALTGIKLRRLGRELEQHERDLHAEREAAEHRHALLDDQDQVVRDKEGRVQYPSPEAEEAARLEVEALLDATSELSDSLCLADLLRKERDVTGKVYETDQVEAAIIDWLGPVLREEEQPAEAKPAQPA